MRSEGCGTDVVRQMLPRRCQKAAYASHESQPRQRDAVAASGAIRCRRCGADLPCFTPPKIGHSTMSNPPDRLTDKKLCRRR